MQGRNKGPSSSLRGDVRDLEKEKEEEDLVVAKVNASTSTKLPPVTNVDEWEARAVKKRASRMILWYDPDQESFVVRDGNGDSRSPDYNVDHRSGTRHLDFSVDNFQCPPSYTTPLGMGLSEVMSIDYGTTENNFAVNVISCVFGFMCGAMFKMSVAGMPVGDVACEVAGAAVAYALNAWFNCCRDDDVSVTITAGGVIQADGDSLEITYYGTDPDDIDHDSLGRLGIGETDTWNEDLGGSDLSIIELNVDETNDICASNFAFGVGESVSGTGRFETAVLPAYVIAYITAVKLDVGDQKGCVWFGDEVGSLGMLRFDWKLALQCTRYFQISGDVDFADCLKLTVYRYDVRQNGGYQAQYPNTKPQTNLPDNLRFMDIRNQRGGDFYCVDISTVSNMYNGARVHLWKCHGGDNQLWELDNMGRIRSKVNTDYCLEAGAAGVEYNSLYIWQCYDDLLHQQWNRLSNGRIKNQGHNKVIGISGGCHDENSNGKKIELHNENTIDWYHTHVGCGTAQAWFMMRPKFQIIQSHSTVFGPHRLCMGPFNSHGSVEDGETVFLDYCSYGPEQLWEFDGLGYIRNKRNRNMCVEAGEAGALYAKLKVSTCIDDTDGMHQRWNKEADGRIRNMSHGKYIGVAGCANRETGRTLELHSRYDHGYCDTLQKFYF